MLRSPPTDVIMLRSPTAPMGLVKSSEEKRPVWRDFVVCFYPGSSKVKEDEGNEYSRVRKGGGEGVGE
jgi:hypothetical protein